ncbi:MAG: polysaccharide deacetylase family protein [Gammaproteobacteria bacterium]|nr:polysaccharide deacetylase family protein [Gammaproteobacteria bacterium]MBU2277502.1 polysaccharide deacetylase family protein [Gammaproteobacteria bacterium]
MQIKAMLLLVFVLFSSAALWRLSSQADFQLFGTLIHRVETTEPLVALTFDDGPTPEKTEQILHVLAKEHIAATFFLTGADVAANPHLVQKILAAGHQVGNHSYSHQRLIFKTTNFIAKEIEQTDTLLKDAGVPEPVYFRPPYGRKLWMLPRYLQKHQRVAVTWDVAPESVPQLAENPELLAQYTVEQAKKGSIILLHVMYDSRSITMQAVPAIIRGLKKRGFRFVTVSELLSLQTKGAMAPLVNPAAPLPVEDRAVATN